MTKIAEIASLLATSQAVEHEIKINEEGEVLRVWVKELSFIQMQDAIKSFVTIKSNGSVDIDLAAYWKYMFAEAIEKCEPRLTIPQLLSLRPAVANKVTALLPQPQDLMNDPLVDGASE